MVALPLCPRECGDPSPSNSAHAHLSRGRRTRRHPPLVLANAGTHLPPNSTHAHLSRGRHKQTPSCPRHPTQPTPISPVADTNRPPLVLAHAGTHPTHAHLSGPRPSLPWQTYTAPPLLSSRMRGPIPARPSVIPRESRNPAPNPMTERLHKTSPSVITNTPSATTMKIAPHTSPRRGNPLWLPSPNSYTFHSEQSEAKSKNLKRSIQRRSRWN